MASHLRDDRAIDRFATSIGDWLLTQRFGSVVPVAYRHFLKDRRAGNRPRTGGPSLLTS